jgi:hypothetical protein
MEMEADSIGLELSARSGYAPNAAMSLWQKMSAQEQGRIEFLSSHPSHDTRITLIAASAGPISQRFAARIEARAAALAAIQVPSKTVIVDQPAPSDSFICALPNGAIESLAPIACSRIGGAIKERIQ